MEIKKTVKSILGDETASRIVQLKHVKDDIYTKKLYKLNMNKSSEFNVINLKKEVCSYVDSMQIKDFQYHFSSKTNEPTLYSSVYACMVKGLFNSIEDSEKRDWCTYFDSFQKDDGLFVDPVCLNKVYVDGDGWGARHLVPHIIIAYQRLGYTPKKEFLFLKRLLNPDAMIKWLDSLNYEKVWGTSNAIMNYGVSMQYARDYMGMCSDKAIEAMQDWLLKHIRKDCGMWFEGPLEKKYSQYQAIRGAYHIYPILKYNGIEIPYANTALDFILNAQNKWGGFDKYIGSTACDDIDAIDPIVRLSVQLKHGKDARIVSCLRKAMSWVLINQNKDGGFVFSRRGNFAYGGTQQLSSNVQQSNMFATWFRTLSILYMQEYLEQVKTEFVKIPGYEMPLQ